MTTIPPELFLPFAGILGLVLGSFYTACVHRYLVEQPLWDPPRSACPLCGHTLSWWENIPLVSYFLLLRGKCRGCGKLISPLYPLMEALSCLWAMALAWKFGFSPEWFIYMAFGGAFLVESFIDFQIYILPDIITLPSIGAAVAAHTLLLGGRGWLDNLESSLLGLAFGGGAFWVLQMLYRFVRKVEGLGTGDVKLLAGIGALLGPFALPVVVTISAMTALLGSLLYILRPGSDGIHTRVPFGPFLCFGAMVHILFGPQIWTWYLG